MNLTMTFPFLFVSFAFYFVIGGANVVERTEFSLNSPEALTSNFTVFVAERRKLLGECTADSNCSYSNSVCKSGHCVCNLPYPIQDHVGQRCLAVAYKENDACELSMQCFISDLECIDHACRKKTSALHRMFKNIKTETILTYLAIVIALIAIVIAIKRHRCSRREAPEQSPPPQYTYDYSVVSPPNYDAGKLPTYDEATRQNVN